MGWDYPPRSSFHLRVQQLTLNLQPTFYPTLPCLLDHVLKCYTYSLYKRCSLTEILKTFRNTSGAIRLDESIILSCVMLVRLNLQQNIQFWFPSAPLTDSLDSCGETEDTSRETTSGEMRRNWSWGPKHMTYKERDGRQAAYLFWWKGCYRVAQRQLQLPERELQQW